MPLEISEREQDFLEGLKQFARSEDLIHPPEVTVLGEQETRTTFRRGDFGPPFRSQFAQALNDYEGGESGECPQKESLGVLNQELSHHGLILEIRTAPRGASERTIISHLIVKHRGRLTALLNSCRQAAPPLS